MKNILKKLSYRVASHFFWMKPFYLYKKMDEISGIDAVTQLNLMMSYKIMAAQKVELPKLNDVEFRVYSENGEDGILLYIFSLIGTANKKAVEICCGDGIQNCTANLIVNHGWQGFLFEGNAERVKTARDFYANTTNTRIWPPVIANEWIAADSINDVIKKYGCEGEVDLLSLDMDGVDYWVWNAISVVQPRVLVCEFNLLWPADKTLTVPNDKNFKADYNSKYGADFSGATLGAFVKLCKKKGYRLVGVQRYGFNAFFIKNGVGEEYFPEVDPLTQLEHPLAVHSRTERNHTVKHRNWVEV